MKCPDAECHDKVIRFTFLVKIVGGAIGLLIAALLAVSMNIMAADKQRDNNIINNEKQIAIIQTDMKHIIKKTDKMEKTLERIEEKMDQDKKDLLRAIRKND